MGLIFGEFCLCGRQDSLSSYTTGGEGTCAMQCLGDNSKTCGGMWVVDLYTLEEAVDPPATGGGGTLIGTPEVMNRLFQLHNAAR